MKEKFNFCFRRLLQEIITSTDKIFFLREGLSTRQQLYEVLRFF